MTRPVLIEAVLRNRTGQIESFLSVCLTWTRGRVARPRESGFRQCGTSSPDVRPTRLKDYDISISKRRHLMEADDALSDTVTAPFLISMFWGQVRNPPCPSLVSKAISEVAYPPLQRLYGGIAVSVPSSWAVVAQIESRQPKQAMMSTRPARTGGYLDVDCPSNRCS